MKKTTDVAEDIKQRIVSGQIIQGEKLPSIKKLAEHYEVSTITVRNAIEQLTAEGFVITRERAGCYVKAPDQKLLSMTLDYERVIQDEIVEVRVLSHSLLTDLPSWAQAGKQSTETNQAVKIDWLYTSFFDAPIAYEECFLLTDDPDSITAFRTIDDRKMIEDTLAEKLRATLEIRLVPAESVVQKQLQLEEGAYVFLFEKTVYNLDDSVRIRYKMAVLPESIILHAAN